MNSVFIPAGPPGPIGIGPGSLTLKNSSNSGLASGTDGSKPSVSLAVFSSIAKISFIERPWNFGPLVSVAVIFEYLLVSTPRLAKLLRAIFLESSIPPSKYPPWYLDISKGAGAWVGGWGLTAGCCGAGLAVGGCGCAGCAPGCLAKKSNCDCFCLASKSSDPPTALFTLPPVLFSSLKSMFPVIPCTSFKVSFIAASFESVYIL